MLLPRKSALRARNLSLCLSNEATKSKSASSSIDNITAESLIEELKPAKSSEVVEADVAEPETDDKPDESEEEESSTDEPPVAVPIVKSKQDIDRERLEKQEAEDRAKEASSPSASPILRLSSDPGAVALAPPPPDSGCSNHRRNPRRLWLRPLLRPENLRTLRLLRIRPLPPRPRQFLPTRKSS